METAIQPPLYLAERNKKTMRALIATSHREPMNLESVLPWTDRIDLSKPPKLERDSWIYGTEYWAVLDAAQRLEVLWKETARDVSMFIWLEQMLPPLYVGYTNRFRYDLSPEAYEYLMIFSKEEIVHTLMFRRYMSAAGLATFVPPGGEEYAGFVEQLLVKPPIAGIFWNLLVEWMAELNAMHSTQDDAIEPLTRSMFREHHVDEVRHIAFGRFIVEDYFATAPAGDIAELREFIRPAFDQLLAEFTYSGEIADHTSFAFPVARDDAQAIAAIRASANNQRLNLERFKDLYAWFGKLGFI